MTEKKNVPEVIKQKEIQMSQDQGPLAQAMVFLQNDGNIESFKAVFELQKAYEAHEAKKSYKRAMAEFKTKPLIITKDKDNDQYGSKYSSIGNIVNSALPEMGNCGLSHKWDVEQPDLKTVKVTCTITHSSGHSESTTMVAPPDTSGNKNLIQQIKSTRTYLALATFENAMGLASIEANVDDDGNGSAAVKYITEKQVSGITDMVNSIEGYKIESFLSWARIDSVELMLSHDFGKSMNALKEKAKAAKNDNS